MAAARLPLAEAGRVFVIDCVIIRAGANIRTGTAMDEDGHCTSVDAVADLDPGGGSYGLPGRAKGATCLLRPSSPVRR